MVETKVKVIIGIAIVILILFGLSTFYVFSPRELSVYGTSTLSISKADLQSSNSFLNGEVWMITFRAGGLGQRYFGSFDPDDVKDENRGGERPTEDFSIEVEYEDQVCNYDISATNSKTPIYDDIKMETWTCLSNSQSKAEENFGSGKVLFFGKDNALVVGTKNCWAVGSPTESPVGNLGSPNLESEFTVTIKAGDESSSKTINTLSETTQGKIGDFAYVDWQGNLVSGKSCPDKDPLIPIYVSGSWRLGDDDSYNDYKASIGDLGTNNRDEREIAISRLRRFVAEAKSPKSFAGGNSFNSKTILNSASVDVVIEDAIQFPVTTLYIKADTLGIFTPTPQIRLFNPDSECFRTGETGSIEVGLENVGDEKGTWNVYVECDDPFKSSKNIQVSLDARETDSKLIPITASASQRETGKCTIFAESPAGTEKMNVGVCVDPQLTCEAGESFCSTSGEREVIKKCSSNGATSSVVETCGAGYYCDDLECIKGKETGDNIFSRIGDWFSNLFAGTLAFLNILKWIIILITTVLSFSQISRLLGNQETFKDQKIISISISIIISLVIGWFLYLFIGSALFWIFVLALILIGIFIKPILNLLPNIEVNLG